MTILIFFIVLSVLVLAHEWGHFITAKKAGAKVEEFGFGFPPKIFSFSKNGTVFSINLIPFGGFVKIFGESGEHQDESGSFSSLKISRRAVVIVAGVVMNIILAWVLLSAGNIIGRPEIIDNNNESLARNIGLQVLDVVKDSPAEQAGITSADQIQSATWAGVSQTFINIDDFQKFISQNAGTEIKLSIKRGQEIIGLDIIPRKNPPAGEGALGVSLIKVGLVSAPWYMAFWQGAKDTIGLIGAIVSGLFFFFKTLFLEGRILGEIAGPVGIASLTGQAYRLGWSYLIQLTAVLSVNLAILNILPFPALDGGRLILLLVEKIKGSPVNQKIEQSINTFGFILLLGLMLFITWKDIIKLF